MGFVLLFFALGVFVVTVLIGAAALTYYQKSRHRGRGLWPPYLAFCILTAVILVAYGVFRLATADGVADPGSQTYSQVLSGFCAIAAAPGLGMLAGLFGLFFRRKLPPPLPSPWLPVSGSHLGNPGSARSRCSCCRTRPSPCIQSLGARGSLCSSGDRLGTHRPRSCP